MKLSLSHLTTFVLGAIIFGAVSVFAWTGPAGTAPTENVPAPINVGTVDQVKNAGLSVNSLAVFGNTILSGVSRYLNFGSTSGSGGYGIRDNAGSIEFKHNGGTWREIITSTIQGGLITGSVTSTSTTATSTFGYGINITGGCIAVNGTCITGSGAASGVPTGAVMAFDLATCPSGWSAYATGNGRFIVGVGTLGSDTYALAATGGEARHTLTSNEMPSHIHSYTYKDPSFGPISGTGGAQHAVAEATTNSTTGSAGGGNAHENRPPYIALLYCKKN